MSNNEIKISRKQAAALLDSINEVLSEPQSMDRKLTQLDRIMNDAGIRSLTRCPGSAHSNPHIDNCGICAPRWGWVGDKIKIT